MKHPATRELFSYWNDLRAQRVAPERSDIDPAAIRNVLADTFMLDVDVAAGFPFRLAGTRVNALFDAEQKGRPFLTVWRPEERRNIAAVLMTVADGGCPVVSGAAGTPIGQEEAGFELLFLPLRHYGKTHSRILGMIKPAGRPAWLGHLAPGFLTLRSLRIVDTPEAEVQPSQIAIGQDTAGPRIYFGEPAPTTRPHLRVIQGGL